MKITYNKIATGIIFILILILIILANAYRYRGTEATVKEHKDSIMVAKKDVQRLKRREREIILKIATDKRTHQKEIAGLQKTLQEAVNKPATVVYRAYTNVQLDSVRSRLYGSDTGKIQPYTMPIEHARQSLESAVKEPMYFETMEAQSNIIKENDEYIGLLETSYDSVQKINVAKDADAMRINNEMEQVTKHYKKELKKKRKWWARALEDAISYGLGFLSGAVK